MPDDTESRILAFTAEVVLWDFSALVMFRILEVRAYYDGYRYELHSSDPLIVISLCRWILDFLFSAF